MIWQNAGMRLFSGELMIRGCILYYNRGFPPFSKLPNPTGQMCNLSYKIQYRYGVAGERIEMLNFEARQEGAYTIKEIGNVAQHHSVVRKPVYTLPRRIVHSAKINSISERLTKFPTMHRFP